MLRGLKFWGWGILALISFTISPIIGHAKSNGSIPSGSESNMGYDTGFAQKYLTKAMKVRVIRLCNDDGSDPGTISSYYIQAGIDEATKILYETSGANIVYTLDPETNLNECVQDTLTNHDCFLNPEYFPGKDQEDITAADLESLTECDLNQDGECDKYDTQHLCDTSKEGIRRKSIAYDYVGSIVIFVRGLEARRRVKFDEELGHWVFSYPSGGYSSCAGNFAVMNSGWWGNLLAHETGHYLCTPHTFGRRATDVQHAEEQIAAVIDKYNLDPTDKENVLISTYDGDRGKVDFLEDHILEDTPPDPGSGLWVNYFGKDHYCDPANDTISVNVNGIVYDLQPDRSLIMSYFKGCTGLGQHWSPDQVDRIELSLRYHRQHLVKKSVVDCYYNKYNATDWEGMEPLEAFNKKDYYLNQCQTPPDWDALRELAHKRFYPIPKPFPIGPDPFTRWQMEEEEIQNEIEMDLELQQLQQVRSVSPIQNKFIPFMDVLQRSNSVESISPTWFDRFLQGGFTR